MSGPATLHSSVQDQLEICLLGGFRATYEARTVEPSAWRLRKARQLVKILALAPGHRVNQDELIELLWPERDIDSGTNNFHRTLHAARQALADDRYAGRMLLRLDDGVLKLYPSGLLRIDVEEFERAAALAQQAHTIAAYQAALGLYAGHLLPEDPYEDWAIRRRDALRQTWADLLITVAQLHEGHNEYPAAIDAYRHILADDPAHEDARRGIMRALALAGKYQQALRHYEDLKIVLDRELGAEPDAASQQLYRDIQSGRFAAQVPAGGSGLHSMLPAEQSAFVGRETEVAAIKELLASARLVTLTGPGGSGKTRLALRVAGESRESFPDGVCFVNLGLVTDQHLVAGVIARGFGIQESGSTTMNEVLIGRLRGNHVLLILDNLEHLPGTAHTVSELLSECAELTILATSRERLRLTAEHEFPVPPLGLPPPGTRLSLDDAARFDTVQLFVQRARASSPDFQLTPSNVVDVIEICRRIDALPLGIELAAARIKVLSPRSMLDRMESRLSLLTDGARDLPARQRTMRDTIRWSYELLDEREKVLFRRAAVFAGGATIPQLVAVWAALDPESPDILAGVASLVDKSLIPVPTHDDDGPRFTMLQTIREYGLEQLAQSGEGSSVRQAFARYFAGLVETAETESTGPRQGWWLNRLELEVDNLRAALAWCLHKHDLAIGLRLTGALWRFWYAHGHLSEGRSWQEQMLAISGPERSVAKAHTLQGAGILSQAQGDYQSALGYLEQSLNLYRDLGDRNGEAMTLGHQGLIARARGDDEQALSLFRESQNIFQQTDNQWGIALILNHLGLLAQRQHEHERALQLLEESLRRFQDFGDRWGAALPLSNLGVVYHELGNYERASQAISATLQVYEEMGDKRNIAIALMKLAGIANSQGDLERGERLCMQSLILRRDLGDKEGMIVAIERLAAISARRQDFTRAARLMAGATVQRDRIGAQPSRQDRFDRDLLQDVLQRRLGDADLDSIRSAGASLPLEQLLAEALKDERRA